MDHRDTKQDVHEETRNLIEAYWGIYALLVTARAKHAWEQVVLPFCVKRHYQFVAGNNNWYMINRHNEYIREETLPNDLEWKSVLDILTVSVPGMPNVDLGCLMPSYFPDEGGD